MAEINFLETLPLNEIARYGKGPPKNGVPFTGYPRQHPLEKNKLILVYDPLGVNPMVMEFRLEDVVFIEELHSAVTESGEGVPLIKLWIRRGARGVALEPFEVDDPIRFIQKTREFRDKFLEET
jgi:inorganic pyrophosphatase